MLDVFGGVFENFEQKWLQSKVDTWVDKLNRSFTVLLIAGLAVMVSAKQYVGEPIHCRHTSTYDGNYEKYMNTICWVTNTYYVPEHEDIGREGLDKPTNNRINYYQWVPLILMIQAMMFYLPHLLWLAFIQKSGMDLNTLVSTGNQVMLADNTAEREKKLEYMCGHLNTYLDHYNNLSDGMFQKVRKFCSMNCSTICGKRGGNFIILLFIFHKILYLINVIGQIFILDAVLSDGIHAYSVQALSTIFSREEFPESHIFPKSAWCQFSLRAAGDVQHKHLVQCVLSVNFFHEKVFITLWLWFVIVAILTGISVVYWIVRTIFRVDRVRYIKRHLRSMGIVTKQQSQPIYKFVQDYLRFDGVFAIRMINMNVSGMVASQMVEKLWTSFQKNNKQSAHQDDGTLLPDKTNCSLV